MPKTRIDPLFSVLIANYNNAIYLNSCVQSIIKQSYNNWEIIIVDDYSNDNSKELYKELEAEPRIIIEYNDKNYGAGYTFKRCFELSKGEIIGMVGSEDCLVENALEIMVDAHIRNKNAGLIYSQLYNCDEELNVLEISPRNQEIPNGLSYLEFGKNAISSFATFKRDIYIKTEGISSIQRRAVDSDIYLKLEEVAQVQFIKKPLYFYRHNKNSISLNENESKAMVWHIIAMAKACNRRGLDIDKIVPTYLEGTINLYKQKIEDLNNSLEIKLGRIIIFPFRKIRSLIKKLLF